MLRAKKTSKKKLRCLQTDDGGKFISIALKDFYKEKSITINNAALYMHQKNRIAE